MDEVTARVTFPSAGNTLAGFLSSPRTGVPAPGVLFIHGGGRYADNLYETWQEYLRDHGYASFAFHCRGVGESGGTFADGSLTNRLRDAQAAYRTFLASGAADPERICVAGSSMGAHVAARFAGAHPEIKALILQSGAAYSEAAETLPLNGEFTREIRRPGNFRGSPAFAALRRFAGAVLVAYGELDAVIPETVRVIYRRSIRTGTYKELPGGSHRLLRPQGPEERRARAALYNTSVRFLDRYLGKG